jgi:DNA invertase Pin-like site-specific DNA recombinase
MMTSSKLTPDRLRRDAIVYIRQSTPTQVLHHQESQRRQYGLAERARELGFHRITVIDEDLGRTGSGMVERPGFQRLVALVCSGEVGAVFCLEASRLARNGRDWHHLIELCGMVGAVLIDPDGIYDPSLLNDRLLLGLKGQMSEYEWSLIRQRSLEAIRQKARRGELRIPVPVGFIWTTDGRIEKDPDQRAQQALDLVFRKMTERGSMRQVLIWFREAQVPLPALAPPGSSSPIIWKLPRYITIRSILTNPVYAGAYAFGKTETRTQVVDGRARKSSGHYKPRADWMVLIKDHHPGYLSWADYERNCAMTASNTHGKSGAEPQAGRGGRALLSGLLRCRRCGRMLFVAYSGPHGVVVRYECRGAHMEAFERRCISFGGLRVEAAVSMEVLRAIEGHAIEAALDAAEQMREQQQQVRRTIELELEQARYEARLAARRYDAVDPDQRLVAAELEARWNVVLQKVQDLEQKLARCDRETESVGLPDRHVLLSLAQDLPALWNDPSTEMRRKQRIVRILIREIVADLDDTTQETVLLIHWAGGRHSELRVKKGQTGKHRHCTDLQAVEVIRTMASKFPDDQIAATLNRLRLRTGGDNPWNASRVYSTRQHHQLPAFDPQRVTRTEVTLKEAAERLHLSPPSVRKMIEAKILPGTQIVECAPWQIPIDAIDTEVVRREAAKLRNRERVPRNGTCDEQRSIFSVG